MLASGVQVIADRRDLALVFFEDVLPLRLSEGTSNLKPITEASGFLGDLKNKTFQNKARLHPTIQRHGCRQLESLKRGRRW